MAASEKFLASSDEMTPEEYLDGLDELDRIANEPADLIFHLQVALSLHRVNWRDVLKVLANRRGAPRR